MPYMEITMPQVEPKQKEQLAARLNEEFIQATGFEDEVLHIRFSEYGAGGAAVAGIVWGYPAGRPYLNIVMYCPRLRFDVKRGLVAALTEAFGHELQKPEWKPAIHILELPYDNIGKDGQLLTDADDELASRPFYYVLPR